MERRCPDRGPVSARWGQTSFPLLAAAVLLVALAVGVPTPFARAQPLGEEGETGEEVLATPSTFEVVADGDRSVLSIQSRPEGARVFVDGEERGATPVRVTGLEEGVHEVILYLPGRGAYRQMVEGRGGRIFVDLSEESGIGLGLLAVFTEPPDARVEVDGKRAGLSPLEVPLKAGRHAVRVALPGFREAEATVEVEPDGRHTVELRLTPKDGALLVISTPAGGEVFLDEVSVGTAWEPLRLEGVGSGLHTVRVAKSGYRDWTSREVRVRSEETTTVLAALLPERDYSWVRLYTEPPGAAVWLDGEKLGATGEEGLKFKADKGAHRLRLELDPAVQPGYRPLEVTVNFVEDEVDYRQEPLRLPPVDPNFTQDRALIARGQQEEALGFLGRVPPEHPSYAEARLAAVAVLRDLGRVREIPLELEALVSVPAHRNNPVLNTALAYWSLEAARDLPDADAVERLRTALEALERAHRAADLVPGGVRQALLLKAHYYAGIASEVLFDLTGESRYIKKGAQAWDVFFARLEADPTALERSWVEQARRHRRSLEFLAKKLEG